MSATTPAEIEAELAQRRDHLAGTVDILMDRARPSSIARRSAAQMRRLVKGVTHNDSGGVRNDRIFVVASAAAVAVGLAFIGRKRKADECTTDAGGK